MHYEALAELDRRTHVDEAPEQSIDGSVRLRDSPGALIHALLCVVVEAGCTLDARHNLAAYLHSATVPDRALSRRLGGERTGESKQTGAPLWGCSSKRDSE